MIVLISLLGKSKCPQLAGLAVLFPAVTLVGYYFLISSAGKAFVRPIILFSAMSVPTVLVFLLVLNRTLRSHGVLLSFALAILAWLLTAAVVLLLDTFVFHVYQSASG